jgi:hypothetical protein
MYGRLEMYAEMLVCLGGWMDVQLGYFTGRMGIWNPEFKDKGCLNAVPINPSKIL